MYAEGYAVCETKSIFVACSVRVMQHTVTVASARLFFKNGAFPDRSRNLLVHSPVTLYPYPVKAVLDLATVMALAHFVPSYLRTKPYRQA